ncbi:hypothetical protein C8J57DRAFT_1712000 [Mycena rebaudengoi]|nr:hypothetical protein C8J57DRAFT_1712000 [Mycena rebaudengoi]
MNKLLVGNRGEMAPRIIRTAKVEGILTVAIYTSSDKLSPHVALTDEALFLTPRSATETESTAYLSAARILALCHATLPNGGYGFLVGREIVCMGERECSSIPSRHQNIIEETASPFLAGGPELRARMYAAATRLRTVEFLADNHTGDLFSLEMNTRIQKYIPGSMDDITFPAPPFYLPSNIDYLARDNGFDTPEEVLAKLVASD